MSAAVARRTASAVIAVAALLGIAACQSVEPAGRPAGAAGPTAPAGRAAPLAPAGPSWAPAPVRVGGSEVVATTRGDRYLLHTRHGDVGFLPGVNLGSTTPGHQPGELAIGAATYRRWFAEMGRLGFRAVRIYTIHPPAFYTELARYNRAHPEAPLYLLQGVDLPDESYVEKRNLFDPAVTSAMTAEIDDAVAAVHGDLHRGPTPGRASGTFSADVSPWLAGWVVGVEWDPEATKASDARNAAAPAYHGRYFTSTPDATPTERWLAARLDRVAADETHRGRQMPLAFVNWPTTDPLHHPDEPLADEDLVGIDANHLRPTARWHGGYFGRCVT